MNDSEMTIYVFWTYLIKEEKLQDWTKRLYAKQVLDEEIWEELQYWRTEARGLNNEPLTSVDEVKELLSR